MLLEMLPMFHQIMPLEETPHRESPRQEMPRRSNIHQQARPSSAALLAAGIVFLAGSSTVFAQRGGGGGGGGAGAIGPTGGHNAAPIICLYDCPALRGGLSSEDSLKNFRRVMAVQATEEQRAAFARIAQSIQDASDRLQAFRESIQKAPASKLDDGKFSDATSTIDQAVERARASNHNFLISLSPAQESGLKETTKKLEIADSDLDRQSKAFDQVVHSVQPGGEQIAASAASLDKALASFQNEHLALGKEMSIIFPAGGQELSFNFPLATNTIDVAGQPVSIPAAGTVSRIAVSASTGTSSSATASSGLSTSAGAASTIAVDNSHNLFNLKLTADLSDLQQNITALLRSQLNRYARCGERTTIQQASFTPLATAGLVIANVHYERWVCPGGPSSAMEVTSGDGEIEIKLTASADPKTGLMFVPEITRVTAQGSLRELLRSGDLGATLRDQVAASLLSALQKTADLRIALPPAVQQSATLQKAQFQEAGVDQLSLVLEGQLQLTDAQLGQFTDQLQQRQSAQKTTTP
jgi:hypothetical protein